MRYMSLRDKVKLLGQPLKHKNTNKISSSATWENAIQSKSRSWLTKIIVYNSELTKLETKNLSGNLEEISMKPSVDCRRMTLLMLRSVKSAIMLKWKEMTNSLSMQKN
jgi:hypothetical protein